MIDDSVEFPTRDMNLSACLMAEGIRYLRVEHDEIDSRRLIFVFDKVGRESDISRVQEQRTNATHIVSSVVYDDKLRALKSIIHSQ
jgi:hypothetical protein